MPTEEAENRIAHAAGDEALEVEPRDAFMARQPLLFEPEYVFDFRLVTTHGMTSQ